MLEKKYISKIIQQNRNCQILTKEDKISYKNVKICHTYETELSNDKVKDHRHITGKYRGAAHDNCNKKYVIQKYILIIFHNLRGYDSNFIVQNLEKYKEKRDIIPNNTEEFMSTSIGNDRNKKGYIYLRFIYSFSIHE